MIKKTKNIVNPQILFEDVVNGDVFQIEDNLTVDSVVVQTVNGTAGNLTIGTMVPTDPGTYEAQDLTVTAGTTVGGTVTIVLNSATGVDIELLPTDTTPGLVAIAIAAGTYTGWTTSVVGAVVHFVKTAVGVAAGTYSFTDTDTTGAAASLSEITIGTALVPAYTDDDFVDTVALSTSIGSMSELTVLNKVFPVGTSYKVDISSGAKINLSVQTQQIF